MLLSQQEILDRVKLYTDLQNAIVALGKLDAALPVECPVGLEVEWPGDNALATAAVKGVCIGAWKSLRDAALSLAKRTLAECEQRVADFESGKEIE